MNYAIMFEAKEGGVIEPIEWNKSQLQPDRSIIVLDESTMSLYLWHGTKQGLVARRTALRQAESLKGHGYTVGKAIIGRDIKQLKEIDARKVGRVEEETNLNQELMELLDKEHKKLGNHTVTFDKDISAPKLAQAESKLKPSPQEKPKAPTQPISEVKPEIKTKPIAAPQPKPEPKPEPKHVPTMEPEVKQEPKPIKQAKMESVQKEEEPEIDLKTDAKVAFVLIAILDHYDDIWVSKKDEGNFSVEMMDGPICTFKITDEQIKFTSNSFSGIAKEIKVAIQKKFIELNKLLK